MKPRHKRIAAIALGVVALGIATALVLTAFRQNLVFFFSPTQVAAREAPSPQSTIGRLPVPISSPSAPGTPKPIDA